MRFIEMKWERNEGENEFQKKKKQIRRTDWYRIGWSGFPLTNNNNNKNEKVALTIDCKK